MARQKSVMVRVTEATKNEWENHVDDPETRWDDLSDLVRGSVSYELNGTHVKQEVQDALDEHGGEIDQDELVDAVDTALNNTEQNLNRVEDNLADLNEQLRTSEAITDLAQDLKSNWLLSLPANMASVDVGSNPDVQDMLSDEANARRAGSAPAYADVTGHSEQMIRRALRRAEKLYPSVKSVIDPSTAQKRYYIEDPDMDVQTMDGKMEIAESIIDDGGYQTGLRTEEQRGAK